MLQISCEFWIVWKRRAIAPRFAIICSQVRCRPNETTPWVGFSPRVWFKPFHRGFYSVDFFLWITRIKHASIKSEAVCVLALNTMPFRFSTALTLEDHLNSAAGLSALRQREGHGKEVWREREVKDEEVDVWWGEGQIRKGQGWSDALFKRAGGGFAFPIPKGTIAVQRQHLGFVASIGTPEAACETLFSCKTER